MDPITHSLIGLGVASFSGEPLSLTNPVYLGALLGSLAPDLDFVLQAKGDIAYLRHHRGASHSIPGSVAFAGGISLILNYFFPQASLGSLFFWSWLGVLSHCIIDIFNSYGAKLLWPFYRKKISCNLLNIFDPLLFVLLILIHFPQKGFPYIRFFSALSILVYFVFRFFVRRKIINRLRATFKTEAKRILVMPALKNNWTWDIFLETAHHFLIGQAGSFKSPIQLKQKFWKQRGELIKEAQKSKLGKFFYEFTPLVFIFHRPHQREQIVQFFDLRYQFQESFFYTGKAVFNERNQLVEEVFLPYLGKRRVDLIS